MAMQAAEQGAAGKRWVEEAVGRIAGELHIPVEGLKWRDDFPGPYLSSLYFSVRGTPHSGSLEFRLRHLEDCTNPGNKAVRASLEEQVRTGLHEVSERLAKSGERR